MFDSKTDKTSILLEFCKNEHDGGSSSSSTEVVWGSCLPRIYNFNSASTQLSAIFLLYCIFECPNLKLISLIDQGYVRKNDKEINKPEKHLRMYWSTIVNVSHAPSKVNCALVSFT